MKALRIRVNAVLRDVTDLIMRSLASFLISSSIVSLPRVTNHRADVLTAHVLGQRSVHDVFDNNEGIA